MVGNNLLFLLLFLNGVSSHSLQYLFLVSYEPNQTDDRVFAAGYVNDELFVSYDSDTEKALPRTSWINEAEKEDPRFWSKNTENFKSARLHRNAVALHNRFNRTGTVYLQEIVGCEIDSARRKEGYWRFGFDGEDFISFDKETLSWTAAVAEAQHSKEKLDKVDWLTKQYKYYLESTCIEWLQNYLIYGNETLTRTEVPSVKVTYDGKELLTCRVYGFFPKEIDVDWVKKGEGVWHEETSRGMLTPNSDGTYYTVLSVKIDPKERDLFSCRVEHDGLQKPLEVSWMAEKSPTLGIVVVAVLLILTVGIFSWVFVKRILNVDFP